jgi:hypothetical protein
MPDELGDHFLFRPLDLGSRRVSEFGDDKRAGKIQWRKGLEDWQPDSLIQKGTTAYRGRKKLIDHRRKDDSNHWLLPNDTANRDTSKSFEAMGKVCGSINGIYDPRWRVVLGPGAASDALFSNKRVTRESRPKGFHDDGFTELVRGRDKVRCRALCLDTCDQLFPVQETCSKVNRRLFGDFNRCLEQRVEELWRHDDGGHDELVFSLSFWGNAVDADASSPLYGSFRVDLRRVEALFDTFCQVKLGGSPYGAHFKHFSVTSSRYPAIEMTGNEDDHDYHDMNDDNVLSMLVA